MPAPTTRSRRLAPGFALALTLAALAAPAAAQAEDVAIGSLGVPGTVANCDLCSAVQLGTDPASASYAVPSGSWTVISWGAAGGSLDGTAKLQIFRPTAVSGQFQIVAESAFEAVPASVNRSFAASIPVQTGDRIGMETGAIPNHHVPLITNTASALDVVGPVGCTPTVGYTVGPSGTCTLGGDTNRVVNVAAVLRRDPALAAPVATPAASKCKKKKKGKKASAAKKKKCKKKKKK